MGQRPLADQLRQIHDRCRAWGDYPRRASRAGTDWLASCGTARSDHEPAADERLRRLEAVLFLAREPLPSRKLCQYANLADATAARTLVRQLNESYDLDGRAFRVEEVAGGFRLLTRPQFAPWLRRLEHVPREVRLSAPALETLAVVAYRQPAGRAEIEAIRGVSCGEILRQLMERDLVRIMGRSDELGRPYLYGTTKYFLQVFGLKSLDKLPRAEEMKLAVVARSIPPAEAAAHSVDQNLETLERSTEEDSHVTTTTDLAFAARPPEDELLADEERNQAEDEDLEEEELEDDDEEEYDDDYDDDEYEEFEDDEDDEAEFDDDDEEDDDFDDDEDEWEEVEDDDEDEWDDDEDDDDDDWDDEEEEEDEDWD